MEFVKENAGFKPYVVRNVKSPSTGKRLELGGREGVFLFNLILLVLSHCSNIMKYF